MEQLASSNFLSSDHRLRDGAHLRSAALLTGLVRFRGPVNCELLFINDGP